MRSPERPGLAGGGSVAEGRGTAPQVPRVDLLWTGGWDSTFRLLQLLWKTDVAVRPHYLVDEERRSLVRELEAMREIRREVEARRPEAAERLLPTEYGSYLATEVEARFRRARRALTETFWIGPQYEVLASYAARDDLDRLELCVERQGGHDAPGRLIPLLESLLVVDDTPAGRVHELEEGVEGPEALFESFTFPLLEHTKLDMEKEADRSGFLPLLERSWTCHDPVLRLPCGACRPCSIAEKEGLGRRIGLLGPMLHRVRWRFRD